MFFGCSNLVLTGVTDTPDLDGITDMSQMFFGCSSLTTVNNMDVWGVSGVTSMSQTFQQATNFNQNIGNWDVSNVIGMTNMFYGSSFNQDIGSWNVSNVINMNGMFAQTSSFNQDIGSWNVSGATNMNSMFLEATMFNQDLSYWCVTNILSLPIDFDTSANNWILPKPIWGTCPEPPTPTATPTITPSPTPTNTETPTQTPTNTLTPTPSSTPPTNYWEITNCSSVFNIIVNFGAYVPNQGEIYNLTMVGYTPPNNWNCWQVVGTSAGPPFAPVQTINSGPWVDCPSCPL
jgi:surface protein